MQISEKVRYAFLESGGEMGKLIRSKDWSSTSLGAPETWPQSLRVSVSIMLRSAYPMFVWWGKDLIMFHNDAYLPVLGKKHPQALGMKASEAWSEIWDQIQPMIESVFSGKEMYAQDLLMLLARKGFPEETYWTFSYSPIVNDDGKIGGLFCACNEETEKIYRQRRIRCLKEVSELQVRLKEMDEIAQDFCTVISGFKADIPFCEYYTFESETGKIRLQTSSLESNGENQWPFQEVIASGEAYTFDNISDYSTIPKNQLGLTRGATIIPVMRSGSKSIRGFLVVGISARQEYNNEYSEFFKLLATQLEKILAEAENFAAVKRREEMLAEIDQLKSKFFTSVSHELRTPVTLLLAPLEELNASYRGSDAESEKFGIMYRSAKKLLKLVNNLIDFSRLEGGKLQSKFQPVDLSSFTANIVSSFRSLIENAGLKLDVITPPLRKKVYADKLLWEKIVSNLVSNAYKFTTEGRISISLNEAEEGLELIVEDTGSGIPEEDVSHLFDRFKNFSNYKGRTYDGVSIGLAMVAEMVKLHHGTISVETEANRGTRFTIIIPYGRDHLTDEQISEDINSIVTEPVRDSFLEEMKSWPKSGIENSETPPGTSDHLPLLLIADDNEDMLIYFRQLLKDHYSIITANDGRQALALAREKHPEIILSDIMMPGMDGMQFLKEIRSDQKLKSTPFIFLSARAGEEAKVEGLEVGADGYLIKPFSARELKTVLKTNLDSAKARKLREDERNQLYGMFMQAPAPIAVLDKDQRFVLANQHYRQLFGKAEIDLIGKTVREAWPEIEGQEVLRIFDSVFSTGKSYVNEEFPVVFNYHGKQKRGYYDFVAHPIFDDDREVSGVMIFAYEVTAQVEARSSILVSEERLKLALESADLGIWDWNIKKDQLIWDKRTKLLFGLPENSDASYDIFLSGVHDDDRDMVDEIVTYTLKPESGGEFDIEYRTIGIEDKKLRWLRSKGKAFFNKNGEAVRFTGTLLDITDLKYRESRLKESEEHFRNMIDSAPVLLWITDKNDSCTYLSKSWYDYTGQTEIEGLGFGWLDVVHPDDRDLTSSVFKNATATMSSFSLEYRLKKADGEYRWFRDTGKPRQNENGEFIGFIGTVIDIDETKSSEHELHKSEERLKKIADSMPQLVWIADANGDVHYYNERINEYGNVSVDDEGHWVWKGMVHPDDKDKTTETWQRATRLKHAYVVEHRVVMKNGNWRWHLSRAFPEKDAEGKVIAWFGTATDIDDLKRIEEAIKESENRYRQLIYSLPIALYTCDKDGYIEIYNQAARSLWGEIPRRGAKWCRNVKLFRADGTEIEFDQSPMAEGSASARELKGEELVLQRLDGTVFHVIPHVQPIFNEGGQFTGTVNVLVNISDQKLNEEKISMLASIVESSDDAIISKTLDGIVTSWNQGAERIFGFTAEEMIGGPISKIIPDDRKDEEFRILEKIKTGQRVEHYQTQRLTKGKNLLDISLSISPIMDKSGRIMGASKISRDITAQKDAEKRIRESEARFKIVADTAPVMIWMSGDDNYSDFFNTAWLEFTGRTAEEEKGEGWRQDVHPDDLPDVVGMYNHAFSAKIPFSMEYRLRRYDGEYRWVSDHAVPRMSPEGNFIGYIGAAIDIHEQKAAREELEKRVAERTTQLLQKNEELQDQRDFVEAIFDASVDAIIVMDKQLNYVAINKSGRDLYQYTGGKSLIGQNFLEVFPDLKGSRLHENLIKAANGEMVHDKNYRSHRLQRNYENYFIPLRDLGADRDDILIIGHDITDILESSKKLENINQLLNKQNKELEQTNNELASFSYVASHDLQEPLRKIRIFGKMILEQDAQLLSDTGKDYFDRMIKAADRMNKLIEALLNFSRTTTLKKEFEVSDLNKLTNEAVRELQQVVDEKGAQITVADLPKASVIPVQFQQMMFNIIGNALKYSRADVTPEVKISADYLTGDEEQEKDAISGMQYLRIMVEDNGIGFDQQYSEKIFELFQRLHGKNEYTGSGIGLAICKKIAKNHNGFIKAFGKPGEGSAFHVYLPIH